VSFHVTGESQNIQQIEPFEGPDQTFIGNGQGLQIHSSGSSYFSSPYNSIVSLSLNHLLHVPNITKFFISVSKFAKDNSVYFEFHSNYCAVKSQVTNEVSLQGNVGSDGLYSFPNIQFQPSSTSVASYCLSSSVNSFVNSCNKNAESTVNPCNRSSSLWHDRLGHPNHHVLQLVLQQCNIPCECILCKLSLSVRFNPCQLVTINNM